MSSILMTTFGFSKFDSNILYTRSALNRYSSTASDSHRDPTLSDLGVLLRPYWHRLLQARESPSLLHALQLFPIARRLPRDVATAQRSGSQME